jgi:hypothetical protein
LELTSPPIAAPISADQCTNAKATRGNIQSDLKGALEKLKLLPTVLAAGAMPLRPAVTLTQRFNRIEAALTQQMPVCVVLANVTHFVAIYAADTETRHVWVGNPALDPADVVEYTNEGLNKYFEFDGRVSDLLVVQPQP